MCGNPFKSPDPPKVTPTPPPPTAVQTQDVDATRNNAADEKRKRGYAATRVADDRNVLTDNKGKRTTLG
jgi:hypothetical protein